MRIDELLTQRKVLVVCGTGGVGKTTLSAALALRATALGRKVVVVTIDPARRLAQALGVEKLGDDPQELTQNVNRSGKKIPGRLFALMPDTRRTFEGFFESLTRDHASIERLYKNPVFQIFAKEFSGTNEYMALQKLAALDASREFDLIVLDTPPSRNTLGFLDGPRLLSRLFEEKLIHWLADPEKMSGRIVGGGVKKALSLLEGLVGQGFMGNLFDFGRSLFEVRVGFAANLKNLMALLRSPDVGFITVSSPLLAAAGGRPNPDIAELLERLERERYPYDGMLLNRCLSEIPASSVSIPVLDATREAESQAIRSLDAQGAPSNLKILRRVPELARDVHSLEDLIHVARTLDDGSLGDL